MSETVMEFTPKDGVLVQISIPDGIREPRVRVMPLDRSDRPGSRQGSSLPEASEAKKTDLVARFSLTYDNLQGGNQPVPIRVAVGYERGNRTAPDDPASGSVKIGLLHPVEQRVTGGRRGSQTETVLQPLNGTQMQSAEAPAPLAGYPLVLSGSFDVRQIGSEQLSEGPYIYWAE